METEAVPSPPISTILQGTTVQCRVSRASPSSRGVVLWFIQEQNHWVIECTQLHKIFQIASHKVVTISTPTTVGSHWCTPTLGLLKICQVDECEKIVGIYISCAFFSARHCDWPELLVPVSRGGAERTEQLTDRPVPHSALGGVPAHLAVFGPNSSSSCERRRGRLRKGVSSNQRGVQGGN